MSVKLRIGVDIGGVISKYPDLFRVLIGAWQASPDIDVFVITDMRDHAQAVRWLVKNDFDIPEQNVLSADYDAHGEGCKAEVIMEYGIDVHIDDFAGYAAHAECLTLFTWPNPFRPYYADSWKTDGSEGTFGRRRWTPAHEE